MDVRPIFAKNVKRFRGAKSLTQSELADKLGVTLQTVFSYESGAQWPRADAVAGLCKALGIRPWQLLAEEGEGGLIPPEVVDQAAALARACGLKIGR